MGTKLPSDAPPAPADAAPDARDDETDRAAILTRRQRFVVAALSGLALTHCGQTAGPADATPPADVRPDTGVPQPCLSPPVIENDASPPPPADAAPQPCLDIALPEDGGRDA
jgi:hypothetical protein